MVAIITSNDFKKAHNFAKENPGVAVEFKGTLPSGISAEQTILTVPDGKKAQDYFNDLNGKVVVCQSGNGHTITSTTMFDKQPVTPGWKQAGYRNIM